MKAGPLTHAFWTRTWPIWARYAAATLVVFVAIGFATAFIIETLQAALVDLTAAHKRIAASEHEKDLILREMVHRTKNDLSILHALFYQQAMRSTEPAIREALSVAADRVHVMGRVHERLTR